jgi:hypothetical protein
VLLRIPFYKLASGAIVKLELEYSGDIARGITFHIGNSPTNDLYGGDRNSTIYNAEIYANDTNLSFYKSSTSLCDGAGATTSGDQATDSTSTDAEADQDVDEFERLLFLNESSSYVNPKTKLIVYIGEKWFRVDNLERNSSIYYNSEHLFTFGNGSSTLSERCSLDSHSMRASPFLYVGLNRAIAEAKLLPGSGLCSANISFLNCHMNADADMNVDVKEMKYIQNDNDSIAWVNSLSYLEPTVEHTPCSGEGVVKLKFNTSGARKVARFDLEFGEVVSGFTFNMGDSPSNNGYGGDSGSTSNSAEMHSNDNRFYVWLVILAFNFFFEFNILYFDCFEFFFLSFLFFFYKFT